MPRNQLFGGRRQRGQAGFTLVEVLVVVLLLGVLSSIAVLQYTSIREAAALQTDLANLRTLNLASQLYRVQEGQSLALDSVTQPQPALDLQTQRLVGTFLSQPIAAQRTGEYYYWLVDSERDQGRWMYSLFELASSSSGRYGFASMTPEAFGDIGARYGQSGGAWTLVDGQGLNSRGNAADLLFVPNPREEYTINTRFKLGAPNGNNYGGVGILFESTIAGGNSQGQHYNDTGYILQFDRHFGQIVIRPRTSGGEGNPWVRVGPDGTSSRTHTNNDIPPRDHNWWATEKDVSIDIRKDSQNRIVLTVRVTDVATGHTIEILQDYSHEGMVGVADPANNFTGLRGWHNVEADFYDLDIR